MNPDTPPPGNGTGALTEVSASELARRIREREISSAEVIEAHLQRIGAVNPRLNAIVQVAADSARERARAADAALARGEVWGPLHGVPFTAKDVFDTAGLVTAVGLPERAGFVPRQDAVVVARMRAAGGILLGKTNCPPGGSGGESANPVYGRTNNPYGLERTAGGSSGGEAAAIAAGLSPLGLGSDSGGSIRGPSHFNGIAGLKPTSGRVPNSGAYDHPGGLSDPRTQIGPLARQVRDLALALPLIAGPDGWDSGVVPMPIGDMDRVARRGLRLAYYADDGVALPTPETMATVRAAAQALAGAGIVVTEDRPAGLETVRDITERYWRMQQLDGGETVRLFADWDRFRSTTLAFMERYDALLCPADYRPAFPHGQDTPQYFNYTLPHSLTGSPCVVVRAGTSPEGLPIGVQVVARPWREDVALAVAAEIERALGGWQAPAFF
jgi:amidase